VAKLTIVRLFLTLTSSQNWILNQLDINNAFLHGDLMEKVYMKLPEGLHCDNSNLVCRLHRYIYGLKQAGR